MRKKTPRHSNAKASKGLAKAQYSETTEPPVKRRETAKNQGIYN